MKQQKHYPSLELCKKLTEIGFPITELEFHWGGRYTWKIVQDEEWDDIEELVVEYQIGEVRTNFTDYKFPALVCPSVMEMIEVMPATIFVEWAYRMYIHKCDDWTHCIEFIDTDGNSIVEKIYWTLPNILAEMIICLKEKNHLSFSE